MRFREKRGSKMGDLIRGKIEKDEFWDKNNKYFGGDLRDGEPRSRDEEAHESDYVASSSGRDEFDSDFDQTDSYQGKRGRKKGQKVKKRIKREGQGKARGRPKKPKAQRQEPPSDHEKSKPQPPEESKKIYKQLPVKPNDVFIVYKEIKKKKKAEQHQAPELSQENEGNGI
jgi:hypothetical protein